MNWIETILQKKSKTIFDFFINKEKITYRELEAFLMSQNLPLKREWHYYWRGKFHPISEWELDECFEDSFLVSDLWNEYLNDDFESRKAEIVEALQELLMLPSDELVFEILIRKGWKSIHQTIKYYEENAILREEMLHGEELDKMLSNNNFYENDSDFCGGCESSPCMCSDPTGRT